MGDNTVESNEIREKLMASDSRTIFANKSLLDPRTIISPNRIVGRNDQIDQLSSNINDILSGNRAPDLLLYGPSGTGKSLITGAVTQELINIEPNFGVIKVNCRKIKSFDEAIYFLAKNGAKEFGVDFDLPQRGIETSRKIDYLFDLIDDKTEYVSIVLDEIDQLKGRNKTKDEDPAFCDLLYHLSRSTDFGLDSKLSVITLTNDPSFLDQLDGRSSSSFHPTEIVFPDYDANELQSILQNRMDAYKSGAVDNGIISYAAALAAADHGDARRAIDLFRTAGELAERNNEQSVTEDHVRKAQDIEEQAIETEQIKSLSPNKQLTLYSIITVSKYANTTKVPIPVCYEVYEGLTNKLDRSTKSQQSFWRYVRELETYRLIDSHRETTNVRERTKFVDPRLSVENIKKPLIEGLNYDALSDDQDLIKEFAQTKINQSSYNKSKTTLSDYNSNQ